MKGQAEDFKTRLRLLREGRKMSRTVLGERCGLSKNQIARYERGEQVPSIDTLGELCDIFGVEADYLLGRK